MYPQESGIYNVKINIVKLMIEMYDMTCWNLEYSFVVIFE